MLKRYSRLFLNRMKHIASISERSLLCSVSYALFFGLVCLLRHCHIAGMTDWQDDAVDLYNATTKHSYYAGFAHFFPTVCASEVVTVSLVRVR